MNIFTPIIQDQVDSIKKLKELLVYYHKSFKNKIVRPLLFPALPKIEFHQFVNTLSEELPSSKIIIMLNEYYLINNPCDVTDVIAHGLPDNLAIGIDNCYISNEILNLLSKFNFSLLGFSENIVRNIHLFKNRIKIISGLTLFLEQISVPSVAYNIQSDAEYQLISDLHINCCSGLYIDQVRKKKRL